MNMKKTKNLVKLIAGAGLSLAMAGLPISAVASSPNTAENTGTAAKHRENIQAMQEKMLAQAKAEDATLEKLVAELNKAPEAKKVNIEAQILDQLVAQHHQMVNDWEAMHARVAQFRREHQQQWGAAGTSATGRTEQSTTTAQK